MRGFPCRRSIFLAALAVLLIAASEVQTASGAAKKPPGPSRKHHVVTVVNATAAHDLWLLKNTTFLDVRTEKLYNTSHIPRAVHITAKLVHQALKTGSPAPPSVKKDILCYEAGTNKAVLACRAFASSAKYTGVRVYALKNGFATWGAAGYPMEP